MSYVLTDRDVALKALGHVIRSAETGCLISERLDRGGRAVVRYGAHGHTKKELAHRVIYRALNRPVAANEELRRICRDSRRLEPKHSELVRH
ncbi:hypothetical protein ACFVYP_11305 [Kitasatospora sp. NPDC058201]|uniref:hypothetical protein n=1 Tax=Streptomycetaceae TaxID=2062 RepID=UPI002E7986E5|nr:hypothetical protein [Streptomyces sp. BE303]MED7947798.1 hypothetical protein [Streptomyces sp. BE303]